MNEFDHERLEVYRATIEFVADDQLQRAATSIVLNIAEGAGEFAPGEKVRFYRMALRSSTECAALLDVCKTLACPSRQC